MNYIFVYIYDLSKGFIKQISLKSLGKQIDGIWHTGIVVFQKEIFFGSNGIEFCQPEGTILGPPDNKLCVGTTTKTETELYNHLSNLRNGVFHGSKYDLLYHNCNTFSNEVSLWLTGNCIPDYIINLPREILSTPLGSVLKPFIELYSPVVSPAPGAINTWSSYENNLEPELTPATFKEPIKIRSICSIRDSFPLLNNIHIEILVNMIDLKNDSSILFNVNDLYDLIEICSLSDKIDIRTKLMVFDVIRLKLANVNGFLSILNNMPIYFMNSIVQNTSNDELENMKCRLICNLIGMTSSNNLTNEKLIKIIPYALQLMYSRTNDLVASSLIRNIVIHRQILEIDVCIEIASTLIHMVSEKSVFTNDKTKENVIGSIYFLAKSYEEIKDLAKSYELDRILRRETCFCVSLFKFLQ